MYEENIKSLRLCADECEEDCEGCAYYKKGCMPKMMRDAAAALEAAEKRIAELSLDNKTLKNTIDADKGVMFDRIRFLEAQLPKEGEWVYEDLDNFRKYKVTCPHCDAWYIGNYDAYDEPSDFNYCPHCGNICNPANLAWEKELSERERKEQTDETD